MISATPYAYALNGAGQSASLGSLHYCSTPQLGSSAQVLVSEAANSPVVILADASVAAATDVGGAECASPSHPCILACLLCLLPHVMVPA